MEERGARCGGLATIADAKVIPLGFVQSLANEQREEIIRMAEAEEIRRMAKAVAKAVSGHWTAPWRLIPCRCCQAQNNLPTP